MQDEFACASQNKAERLLKKGRFKDGNRSSSYKTRKGEVVFGTDEFPRFGTTVESLSKIKASIQKGRNSYSRKCIRYK